MDALAPQVLLDLLVVLNDAVVYQGHLAVGADMGMGVDVVGLAVSGPAGVADAKAPLEVRPVAAEVSQDLQPALALADLQAKLLRPDRDPGGVIAPVLHPLQAIQQDRGGLYVLSHKTNNSAHKMRYPPSFVRSTEWVWIGQTAQALSCLRHGPRAFVPGSPPDFAPWVRDRAWPQRGIRRIFDGGALRRSDAPLSSLPCLRQGHGAFFRRGFPRSSFLISLRW